MSDVLWVSYSQVSTYGDCPYKWYLNYREGWKPIKESPWLSLGSKGHSCLEAVYKARMLEPEVPWQDVLPTFIQSQEILDMDDLNNWSHASSLVSKYFTEFAPQKDKDYKILGVENTFSVLVTTPKGRQFMLNGVIDLILQSLRTGFLWTLDHKFTKRFWSPLEVAADVQQPIYGYALSRAGSSVKGMILNQFNTYPYKNPQPINKLYKRERSYRTSTAIDNTLLELGKVMDEMIDHIELGTVPRRHLGRHCKDCHLADICLTRLEGGSVDELIGVEYEYSPKS